MRIFFEEQEYVFVLYLEDKGLLTLFLPMFPFDPPENIRKPLVFWCFQGDQKGTLGRKGLSSAKYAKYVFWPLNIKVLKVFFLILTFFVTFSSFSLSIRNSFSNKYLETSFLTNRLYSWKETLPFREWSLI